MAGPLSGNFVFWTVPPTLLAGSIALINSIGSVSGWVGPTVVGWLADKTSKTSTGLYVVAGMEMVAAILILLFMPLPPRFEGGRVPTVVIGGDDVDDGGTATPFRAKQGSFSRDPTS